MATSTDDGATDNAPKHYNRFEKARIVGARALQVSMGAPIILADLPEDLHDPVRIAELEYKAGVIPVTVRRGAVDVFGRQRE